MNNGDLEMHSTYWDNNVDWARTIKPLGMLRPEKAMMLRFSILTASQVSSEEAKTARNKLH